MVAQVISRTGASARHSSFQSNPTVSASADVHEFSLVEGNVSIGAGTVIAPGTAVTAAPGASVVLGDRAQLLPGVIVEATQGPQVTGEDGRACSIWVGEGSAIAHKSFIHSPAYIGEDCFIGFRSTLYNARLGNGCIVMMHVLIQDVEVPPGKCIPSGSVITNQHQADQLPSVRPEDIQFVKEIVGAAPGGSRAGGSSATQRSDADRSKARLVPIRSKAANRSTGQPMGQSTSQSTGQPTYSTATEGANMQTQRLSPEIVQQVRQHLSQGYRIGMEHADQRRYRSGVWETCPPIKDSHEQAVFAGLERCLAEHQGEYVRMFGINPQAKSRVGMTTVQRPSDQPQENTSGNNATTARGAYGSSAQATQSGYPRSGSQGGSSQDYSSQNGGSQNGGFQDNAGNGGGPVTPGIAQEVRNLLSSGYIIGTEHASPRHYRSNVWKVCSPIKSKNEREVFSRLEHCLEEHGGEYVRMFGIDPKANRRTTSTTIQRADGKAVEVGTHDVPNARGFDRSESKYSGHSQNDSDASDAVTKAVGLMIRSGNKIGVEFADKRRYRSGIWQTAPTLKANNKSAAISQLQNFLNEHPDKYVRIFGIDTEMKTRGSSATIQKPGQKSEQTSGRNSDGQSDSQRNAGYDKSGTDPINANPPHYDDPAYRGQPSSYSTSEYSAKNAGNLDAKVMDQVTQLVNQGHKISVEYADKRRYRSGIWKTGEAIDARRPAEAISALGKQLAQHQDNYVRLVGVDPNAKRRVLETTIQRPGQSSYNSVSGTGKDPINANPPHYDDPTYRGQPSSYSTNEYSARRAGGGGGYNNQNAGGYSNQNAGGYGNGGNGGNNGGGMESQVMDQVTQLVNQGHKISVEYADKRRYRSGIWKTGEAIDARRPAEAISALGKQLARHQGEYVRLIGTDTNAKRRVLEATIQRP